MGRLYIDTHRATLLWGCGVVVLELALIDSKYTLTLRLMAKDFSKTVYF